ncbi:hypothetical protein HAX54_027399 [Datura stramonium]|uniref:Uncharacterized protein n=1 Tax=Datura stramonium TaxID=4076 RepID=A0ABS8V4I2_DATST|nr:hypothetical protein [Datura stramonium]
MKEALSPAIGKLSELKELSLPNNHFCDQIPVQILDCRKLEIFYLQNNLFSGKVPSELASLICLQFVDFSSNDFYGNLNFLKNLCFLNISGNSFLEGLLPFMRQAEHFSNLLNREPKQRRLETIFFFNFANDGWYGFVMFVGWRWLEMVASAHRSKMTGAKRERVAAAGVRRSEKKWLGFGYWWVKKEISIDLIRAVD